MRALTLWQPWASLVACGRKTIETRSWRTGYRGPLAVHASARPPRKGECPGEVFLDGVGDLTYFLPEAWTEEEQVKAGYPPDGDLIGFPLPLGAVVATCTLVDCVPMRGPGDVVGPACYVPGARSAAFPEPDGPWLWQVTYGGRAVPYHGWVDVRDQAPFGDFRPGRFAWLLADIRLVHPPVPAQGRQGLWNWGSSLPGGLPIPGM